MKKSMLLFAILATVILTESINAQEIGLGADVVSRYIWRGAEAGENAPSFQPTLEFSYGGFTFGTWGAYSIGNAASVLSEQDIYASYTVETSASGAFTLGVTDYYYASKGKFGNFDDKKGSPHVVEASLGYSGPEKLPVSLLLAVNVFNDEDNTFYAEIGYSATVEDVGLNFFLGMTPGGEKAVYYGTEKFNVINIGVTATKEIKITENFSLPVFASWIVNPNQEVSALVFGVSL